MDGTHLQRRYPESAVDGIDACAQHARFLAACAERVCAQVGVRGNDYALLGVSDDGEFVRKAIIG